MILSMGVGRCLVPGVPGLGGSAPTGLPCPGGVSGLGGAWSRGDLHPVGCLLWVALLPGVPGGDPPG